MVHNPVIFISSTSNLRSARDLVGKVLYAMGYEPVWQDIEATDGGELIELLRRRLAPCAMVVQLVGQRYGAEPPRPTPEFGRVSYTQFEALEAERVGKKVIYSFIDERFPTDAAAPEPQELTALQAAYRQRLVHKNRVSIDGISTPAGLELSIRRINQQLAELRRAVERRQRRLIWLGTAAVAGVAGVATLVSLAMHRRTKAENQIVAQRIQIAEQETEIKNGLAEIREQLTLALAPTQLDPGQRQAAPLAPQSIAQAKILLEDGDGTEDRALADIALKKYAEADQIIQGLKSKPGLSTEDLFRLLTLEGHNWYRAGQRDKAIAPYEQAMALKPDDVKARNHLILALIFAHHGNIGEQERRAIELAEATLNLTASNSADWAMIQSNLGLAWARLPTGNQGDNINKAITAYEAALTVHTKTRFPDEWARTQNNLAAALSQRPTGDRSTNVTRAIDADQQALTVWTPNAFPTDWAAAQDSLGCAWVTLPTGNRNDNIQNAIAAFNAALTVYTVDADPADWAQTQDNLGSAFEALPTGDRGQNLQSAIASYNAALTIFTNDSFPFEWARAENNIGEALCQLPAGNQAENLQEAIDAFNSALTVWTPQSYPSYWAKVENNLGNALRALPVGDRGENFQRAIEAFNAALRVSTKEADPAEWADLQNNLAITWCLSPAGDRGENLQNGIAAFNNVLTVYSQDRYPREWARTQVNLGLTWRSLPIGDRRENLQNAIAAFEAALTVYTPQAYPDDAAKTENSLRITQQMLNGS